MPVADFEKLTVVVSAHRLDSYRSIEQRAHHQWLSVLDARGDQCRDAGIQLVDSQPDPDLVDHLVYRFEGTTVTSATEEPGRVCR